jgi:hypothetical protein
MAEASEHQSPALQFYGQPVALYNIGALALSRKGSDRGMGSGEPEVGGGGMN